MVTVIDSTIHKLFPVPVLPVRISRGLIYPHCEDPFIRLIEHETVCPGCHRIPEAFDNHHACLGRYFGEPVMYCECSACPDNEKNYFSENSMEDAYCRECFENH